MGDISTRRGRIVGTDSNDAGETIIIVRVPYAEVVSYTKDLPLHHAWKRQLYVGD